MRPAKLASLVARCSMPIYGARGDVQQVASALVELSSYCDTGAEVGELLPPLRKFFRRDLDLAAPFLCSPSTGADCVVPLRAPSGGRNLAILLRALPLVHKDTGKVCSLLQSAAKHVIHGLQQDHWPSQDVKSLVLAFQKREHDHGLVGAVEAYVTRKLVVATESSLVDIVSTTLVFPELLSKVELLRTVSARALGLAERLSVDGVDRVCTVLNRAQYRDGALAFAFQGQVVNRMAEEGKGERASLQLFAFACRHDVEHISVDALQWLLEGILSEPMDTETFTLLCQSLHNLPMCVRAKMTQEVSDAMICLSERIGELLLLSREEGGLRDELSVEVIEAFFLSFLCLIPLAGTTAPEPPEASDLSTAIKEAVAAGAAYITDRVEMLMESGTPPLQLISSLLGTPSQLAQRCGLALLREAAKQHLCLSTLDTFRLLLLIGEHRLADGAVLRFLRNAFAKSTADIPPVQFCTALRCIWRGGTSQVSTITTRQMDGAACREGAPEEDEVSRAVDQTEIEAFFQFCVEKACSYFSSGSTLQCAMAIAESLYRLGCRDGAFFEKVAVFVDSRLPRASPAAHSVDSAKVICLALGEGLLERFPNVHIFLSEVEANGIQGELQLSPVAWMDMYDPANHISPLTKEQQESWHIVEKMVQTRSDDREALLKLAKEYTKLLSTSRPDDLKYFFGVFEEKVLKEDRVLKDSLECLLGTQIIHKLSATTIAAILHSLAALRFSFSGTVKQFMLKISAEQWAEMDATPLVQILAAMSRMSLRVPGVLSAISERLSGLITFLSPRDTAEAIRAFQALGFYDDRIIKALVQHAASSAGRFDAASMVLLFTSPSIHRLLRTPEVAAPLLKQLCAKVDSLHLRQRVAMAIKKTGLPRELIEASTARLRLEDQGQAGVLLKLA